MFAVLHTACMCLLQIGELSHINSQVQKGHLEHATWDGAARALRMWG